MAKWQPIMLITEKRFECKCGAMAIFVQLWSPDVDDAEEDWRYKAYCQDCFERAQETEEETHE